MRLVRQDRTTGEIRLRLETPSDLWRLARLVHPGDRVGSSTTRRDPEAPLDVAAAERTRRRVWLVVATDSVEFHGFSQHVRVSGPIVDGPFDLGRHHTLDIGLGDEVAWFKPELSGADRSLLEEGLQHRGDPEILIASVDWGESSLLRVRGRAVEPIVDLRRTLAGKQFGATQASKDRETYLTELVALVRRSAREASVVAIAGPGFLKEELSRRLIEEDPPLKSKIRVYATAESGRSGADELLRSGRAADALRGTVAAEEATLVEALIKGLASRVRAAVGAEEVGEAVDAGAVETLLVGESHLADPNVSKVLDRARSGRARIFVVRDTEGPGTQLRSFGGIAAILRYDWTSARPTG
ncbi:MAG: hypothetical protein LVQ64_04005 [Thermoplasmatales archaeon]|nr:hypothetical protein [Thermoplasmatales archaeon]